MEEEKFAEEDPVKIIAYSLSKDEVQTMIQKELKTFQRTLFASRFEMEANYKKV